MNQTIITDVTRMRVPNVCVAGLQNGRVIRLNNPQPDERMLRSIGGLRPGDRVGMRWLENPFINPPHVEDGTWQPCSVVKLGTLTSSQLVDVLRPGASDSIETAFGPEWFRGAHGNGAFHPGEGKRSLTSLVASEVRVYQWFEGVRVDFSADGKRWTAVPLEDLVVRRHQRECPDCRTRFNRNLAREFATSTALLRVGLTRPYQSPQHETACWLQVTGVYPLGRERRHFI